MSLLEDIAALFADRLRRWTVAVAPPDRRAWAEAMVRELDEVADPRAALGWAWGCFSVCLGERIESMRELTIAVRLALAGACALFAAAVATPLGMILAWRVGNTSALEAMEGTLPGDDAERFAPLFAAVPDWLIWSSLASIALYLAAGLLIVLRHKTAPWVFLAVLIAAAVTLQANHMNPVFQDAFTPSEQRSDYVLLALKAAVAAAFFWAARPREEKVV
jgi:hypothetical protein